MAQQLIHANLSLAKYPIFDAQMHSFWDREKAIYDQARQYAGFIRQVEITDRFSVFPEPYILNASVWSNANDLKAFVYSGLHAEALKYRKDWFEPHDYPKYVLFWAPQDVVLTEKNLSERFFMYAANGATKDVFDFKSLQ